MDNEPDHDFQSFSSRNLRKLALVSAAPLVDGDLLVRRLLVRNADVVFVKGVFEASEGLCCMFAEKGGDLLIAAPLARASELDELLADLVNELGAVLTDVQSGRQTVG